VGSHFGTFETGFKIRNAHKFDNSYDMVLNMASNEPVANHPEWASSFTDPHFYDGTYPGGVNLADMNKIRQWANASGLGYCTSTATAFTAAGGCNTRLNNVNYDLVERVSAGYLMNTIDLSSRLRLVTGVRFENTYVNTLSYGINPNTPAVPDPNNLNNLVNTYVNQNYLDVLPSASLRIAIDKDSGIRLVYGRGLARPDPEMITASIGDTGNQAPNGNELYTTGNTHLTAEYSDSFDILYERYLKPIGLIQAGYFYKMISNPLIQVEYPGTLTLGGTATPVEFQQYQNAQSAHVQGIELAYQQHLSFLPGPMRFLGVSANYSYTQSQLNGFSDPVTGFAYRTDKPALVGQAPNTWNISPTFDTKKFSLRVGMSYNGPMIYQYLWVSTPGQPNLGAKGPAGDQYFYSHYQIDMQGSYKIYHGLQVYGYGLNLNNEAFGFFAGSPQYVNQREYYKPTFAGGLRYTLNGEK
jgi:TonB-dependent receptor